MMKRLPSEWEDGHINILISAALYFPCKQLPHFSIWWIPCRSQGGCSPALRPSAASKTIPAPGSLHPLTTHPHSSGPCPGPLSQLAKLTALTIPGGGHEAGFLDGTTPPASPLNQEQPTQWRKGSGSWANGAIHSVQASSPLPQLTPDPGVQEGHTRPREALISLPRFLVEQTASIFIGLESWKTRESLISTGTI